MVEYARSADVQGRNKFGVVLDQSYRPLAVRRAVTTNIRRFAMLVAFAGATSFLAQFGLPTSPAFFSMFGIWALVVASFHFALRRIRTNHAADLLQTGAFVTDITFLTIMFALIGGGWWIGAATHSFIVTFSLASLPRRRAGAVAGYAIFAFLVLLYAQSTGIVQPHPFLGVPGLLGNPRLAVIVAVFGLIPLTASALVQHTFVRIMRRSQERYRVLLQTAPDMILSTDKSGVIISANASAAIQAGQSEDELIGRSFRELLATDDRSTADEHLGAAYTGESRQFEIRYASTTPAERWLLCTCNPIREDDTITGILIVGRDISSSKRNELALRESEEKLRQSQKMEAIGRLAGGVAHDFNNLLTVIDLHSQLLLEELGSNDSHREGVEEIRKAGTLAATLTKQLLAFSRKQKLSPGLINLSQTVAGMEKLLQRLIGSNISVVTRLSTDLSNVYADAGQLEQIVMNLAINARDAMPGGGTLTIETANVNHDWAYVETHPWMTPGPYVMLSVSDTGFGMDEETKSHVFEPFFTTKAIGEGTGLGLSTVYGVVNQSGGSLEVYSEVGQGTAFKIYLPAMADGVRAEGVPELSEAELVGTETILLVDDADALREIAHRTLSRAGYRVLAANGGAAALRLQEREPGSIDLLLTDVIMPEMTGPEVARRIRERQSDMRVLYMSGYAEGTAVNHFEVGIGVAFLGKPFSAEQLLRSVRTILSLPSRPPATKAP